MRSPGPLDAAANDVTTYDVPLAVGSREPREAAPTRGRHWTDWVGFFAMLAFALKVVLKSGSVGLMLLPALLHDTIVAFIFLIRGRARRTAPLRQQVIAYAATFIVPAFVAAASTWWPHWLAPVTNPVLVRVGLVLWLFGSLVGLWPLWRLRTAFSIAPAARSLVTTGPYRLARHPIYTSYMFLYAGIWITHVTVQSTLLFVAWFLLVLVRIRYEEEVLAAEFPEYHEYRRRVGAFGPRLLPQHR